MEVERVKQIFLVAKQLIHKLKVILYRILRLDELSCVKLIGTNESGIK